MLAAALFHLCRKSTESAKSLHEAQVGSCTFLECSGHQGNCCVRSKPLEATQNPPSHTKAKETKNGPVTKRSLGMTISKIHMSGKNLAQEVKEAYEDISLESFQRRLIHTRRSFPPSAWGSTQTVMQTRQQKPYLASLSLGVILYFGWTIDYLQMPRFDNKSIYSNNNVWLRLGLGVWLG